MTAAMTWCTQCFAVPGATPATARWQPPAARVTVRPQTSRWRGGTMSFGPVGRVSCTAAWLAVVGLLVFAGSFIGLGFWLLVVGPLWMRDVWKPARIA